jgi:argininosuccinate lyase
MKLWRENSAGSDAARRIEAFTAARDREFDMFLAPYDVIASIAHVRMLASAGLLPEEEAALLIRELRAIHKEILRGDFAIEEGVEDVHSQVESLLTRRLGDVGKKVHTGRSRNDQVLVDVKLFLREEIRMVASGVRSLFDILIEQSERHRTVLIPGYTHLQVAMPSSFGFWFAAWAECLSEDLELLHAGYLMSNRNPLGSGAGYGSSFPLDRELTTRLLCFDAMHVNVIAAQMSRGRTERAVATGLAALAGTLARLAMDVTLFLSQNFAFLSMPSSLTTGSSIMPHKKNPDVFELLRARCNRIQALPNDIAVIFINLPSGYHRDVQIVKELLFPALSDLKECLDMAAWMISRLDVNNDVLAGDRYAAMFSVEAVNDLVRAGVPFRDAYHRVAADIEVGVFVHTGTIAHTHTGSIGNLRNDLIRTAMEQAMERFHFERLDGLKELLNDA